MPHPNKDSAVSNPQQTSPLSTKPAHRGLLRVLLAQWAKFAHRNPWAILAFTALVTVLAGASAAGLRVDTDLQRLLPDDAPQAEQMRRAVAKTGDLGYFGIVVEGEPAPEAEAKKEGQPKAPNAQVVDFATELARRLRDSPMVRQAVFKNPVEFLQDNAFVLLPVPQLEELEAQIEYEKYKSSPFYIEEDEDDTEEPNKELEEAKQKYEKLQALPPYQTSPDGRLLAVRVLPRNAVTNVRFVRKLHQFILDQVAELRPHYAEVTEVHIGGSLRNRLDEYTVVLKDVSDSATLGGFLILALLLIYYRNITTTLITLGCALLGLLWAAALVNLTLGFLNLLSATILVVLVALGIDHGIHLLRRYRAERERGMPSAEAIVSTFEDTGAAVAVSGLTTAFGFGVLTLTDFQGFAQLGVIAGLAVFLTPVAYFLVLPPIVSIAGERRWERSWGAPSAASSEKNKVANSTLAEAWLLGCSRIPAALAGGIMLALVVGGGVLASQLEYNDDFRSLMATVPEGQLARQKLKQVYGDTQTPGAVFFAPDLETRDELVAALQARREKNPESSIGRIRSRQDFLPSAAEQSQRLQIISRAARQVSDRVLESVKGEPLEDMLRRLKDAPDRPAVAEDDIPSSLRAVFETQDGSGDELILVYSRLDRRKARNAIAFAEELQPVELKGHTLHPAGDTLVMSEMMRLALEQGLYVFIASLIAMAAVLVVFFRRKFLIPFGALIAGLGLMVVGMRILVIDINFYNMVVFAAIVGLGIDTTIHLFSTVRGAQSRADAITRTASVLGPVTIAFLTTAIGYATMLASHHPGIRSLGALSVTGLTSTFVVATTFLLSWLIGRLPSTGPATRRHAANTD